MDGHRSSRRTDESPRRSRSPRERRRGHEKDVTWRRSRSPRRHHRHHHHGHHHAHHHEPKHEPKRESKHERSAKVSLPFRSSHLHKSEFDAYQPLFAEYLDLQKSIQILDLSEEETRGRWKSFVGKWNRGELAAGWYDPTTKERLDERWKEDGEEKERELLKRRRMGKKDDIQRGDAQADDQVLGQAGGDEVDMEDGVGDEDEDDYGPALPADAGGVKRGPTVPGLEDLQHRRELADEDRDARRADLRYERKQDRQTQKERLDELAPGADPGSRERQLEKKREVTSTNRAFADAKEAGAEEVGESDLMGDDGEGFKAQKRANEKKKSERELRKEEVLRAREAEREDRLKVTRKKEEKTMDMLKALAQERYGGSGQ